MSAHSNLGPSSAERWFNCAGSVALSATLPPSKASIHAAEGTVAHTLAEEYVTGKIDYLDLSMRVGETVKQDGFDVEISDEMVDGAVEYATIIASDRARLEAEKRPMAVVGKAEVRVHAKTIGVDLWGTSDYLLYRKGHKLIVYDYKFGKGVAVEADENKQMAIYAIGAMDTEAGSAFDEVELVIIQPRAPHVDGIERRWTASREWLSRFRTELSTAVRATESESPKLAAGDWCRFCPAKAVCPELLEGIQKQAKVDFAVVAPPPVGTLPNVATMPVEKLAAALTWEDAINSWYEALHARALELLSRGESVPGYKLVDGRSNRKWVSEDAVVSAFSSTLGEARLFEKKLLSPAKLEKIVGKGKLEELGLTMKPEAPKAIARVIDPRPVARASAKEDFDPSAAQEKLALPHTNGATTSDLEMELLGETRKKLWP